MMMTTSDDPRLRSLLQRIGAAISGGGPQPAAEEPMLLDPIVVNQPPPSRRPVPPARPEPAFNSGAYSAYWQSYSKDPERARQFLIGVDNHRARGGEPGPTNEALYDRINRWLNARADSIRGGL